MLFRSLGIIGCKFIDGTGNFLPESKRNIPTPKISFLKTIGKGKSYYANHLSENKTGKASVFTGAFMFMERQKYLELKGFDEDFFMYGEDIDLSYRAEKQGHENYYFAETTIIHYKGESTTKDKVYLDRFYGAMKIFYNKHFKSNLLTDLMIVLATKLFPVFNPIKENTRKITLPESYIFISDDDKFRLSIAQKLLKDVTLVREYKTYNFSLLEEDSVEIIFDGNYISNKEIIAFMQKYKNLNLTFKIKPKSTHFIIGSNSKNDKGEVIVF